MLQNIEDDGYTEVVEDRETPTGVTGTKTAAVAKEYEGFTPLAFEQETIKGDETTEVNIYYNRNKFTVRYLPGEHGTLKKQKNVIKDIFINFILIYN